MKTKNRKSKIEEQKAESENAERDARLARRLCNAVRNLKYACIQLSELAGQSCREEYDHVWERTLLEILEGHPTRVEDGEASVQKWIAEERAEAQARWKVTEIVKTAQVESKVLLRILSEMCDDKEGQG
jgi:hypothetical protein